jgi:hypothetical protein
VSAIFQGSFDGFCGLYAATHLAVTLAENNDPDAARAIFFELLKSLERQNRLTAKRIGSTNSEHFGFTATVIEAAFNGIPETRRLGLAAIRFSKQRFQNSDYRGFARRAFKAGCGLIVSVDAGGHWVATNGYTEDGGTYKFFDPSPEDKRTKLERIGSWNEGLMIGPSELIANL